MEPLSNTEAFAWLYAFSTLVSISSVIWMSFVATAFGHRVKRMQIGSLIRFVIRKHDPEIVVGLVPLSAHLALREPGEGLDVKRTLADRIVNALGQSGIALLFASAAVGPTAALSNFSEIAKAYFYAGLSPLTEAPALLASFWTNLRASLWAGLATVATVYAFTNCLFHLWEIALSLGHDKPERTVLSKVFVALTTAPLLFIIAWFIALVKALI